jgi:hypothetical protein
MSLAEAPRCARRCGHARGHAGIRRSARTVSCRLCGHLASGPDASASDVGPTPRVGRTARPPVGRAFHDLNGPIPAAREGLVGSAATGDAGPSPGTCGARAGRPDGAGNDARRAGGANARAAKRTGASQVLVNGSTSVQSGSNLWLGALVRDGPCGDGSPAAIGSGTVCPVAPSGVAGALRKSPMEGERSCAGDAARRRSGSLLAVIEDLRKAG